jgi:hypothetical protein
LVSILLPCDPGWAYRTSWRLTSGRTLRRNGVMDPNRVHADEHPQAFVDLAAHLRAAFDQDTVRVTWWPLPVPSRSLNLFTVWQVTRS